MDSQTMGQELKERRERAEEILKEYLPYIDGEQRTVLEAMVYSALVGGKRLRPVMMLESYRIFGGEGKEIGPPTHWCMMICPPWTMTSTAEASSPPMQSMVRPWVFWRGTGF